MSGQAQFQVISCKTS